MKNEVYFNSGMRGRLASLALIILFAFKGLATDYPGTWTSVNPSIACTGNSANYTFVATNPTSTGGGTANSYVPSGKAVVITFPAGFTLGGITGGTLNSTAIGTINTTATTISFNTPVAISKGATITIILNGITNHSTAGNYQVSMTIDNATGTGAGNQNTFAAGASSQFTLVTTPTGGTTVSSAANPVCTNSTFTLSLSGASANVPYQWQSSPNGSTWTNISGATSSTYATSISSNTYFRCSLSCGSPVYSSSLLVTQALCYCTPTSNCGANDYITNFVFSAISNNSGGCAGSTSGYTNYPTSSFTASVTPTLSYTASVTVGPFTEGVGIWIDFDQSGTFDASEFFGGSTVAANGTASIAITVPSGATPGQTRMRVRCNYNTAITSGQPCTNFTYGETEDYTITINALTACSGTPAAGTTSINPSSGCSGGTVTLSSTGSSLNSGLTYQWQKSTDGGVTWTNIGAAMSVSPSSITDIPTVASSYRLYATCSNSGLSSSSNVVTYTISGTITAKTWIGAGAGGSGTNFNAAANWSPAGVPTTCDSIRIILTSSATITLSASTSIGALVFTTSGALSTGILDCGTYLLTVSNTSTYDAISGAYTRLDVQSAGAGVIHNGNCTVHVSGTGTTWVDAGTASPGLFQCNANLTVGTRGRTAAGVEPKIVFDGMGAQTWNANNTLTYFLGEDVIFGLNNSPVITLGGTGTYTDRSVYNGNVQINNSTIVKAMDIPVDRFTGTGTFSMASGSKLELNYTNDMPAPYTYALDANSTVEYLGVASSQSVNGITYGHMISGGSGTKTAAGNMTIAGNFTINSGSTYNASTRTHNLRGNFTNNGTFTSSTSTFIMDGTANQNIQGSVSSTFYNLTVNKTSGIEYLQINTQVGTASAGVMSFQAGEMYLNGFRLTINNTNATAVTRTSGYAVSETNSATNNSIIQWNMTAANTGAHVYPFGVSGSYIPFTFNKTSTANAANISISTRRTSNSGTPAGSDNTPWTTGVTNMWSQSVGGDGSVPAVIDRWWDISSSAAVTADLTFSYVGTENTTSNPTGTFSAQHWNGSSWDAPVGTGVGVTGATVGTVTVSAQSTFSPWVLAYNLTPLPIELLGFTAKAEQDKVRAEWTTASEINNDYFTVERSRDGDHFEPVGIVDGAEDNLTQHYYSFIDPNPFPGISYYRLKQTDKDLKFSYSNVEKVEFLKDGPSVFTLHPNPAENNVMVAYSCNSEEQATVNILDYRGKVVLARNLQCAKGENASNIDIAELPAGMYFVTLSSGGKLYKSKLIKQKQ